MANSEPREKPRQKLGLFQNLLGQKKEAIRAKRTRLKTRRYAWIHYQFLKKEEPKLEMVKNKEFTPEPSVIVEHVKD